MSPAAPGGRVNCSAPVQGFQVQALLGDRLPSGLRAQSAEAAALCGAQSLWGRRCHGRPSEPLPGVFEFRRAALPSLIVAANEVRR